MILVVILEVLFVGIIGILCLFSCIVASKADEYWKELKRRWEDD